jgi:hypothetical protein
VLGALTKLNVIEGVTNQSPGGGGGGGGGYSEYQNNPEMLAEKNAANIQYLKEQLDKIDTLTTEVLSLKNSVAANTYAINRISTLAASHANTLVGRDPKEGVPKMPTPNPTPPSTLSSNRLP